MATGETITIPAIIVTGRQITKFELYSYILYTLLSYLAERNSFKEITERSRYHSRGKIYKGNGEVKDKFCGAEDGEECRGGGDFWNCRKYQTTLARAKEIRKIVDKLVSWGKQNDLSARRQAYRILKDHTAVKKLFDEIAPQFNSKQGGYSLVLKAGFRKGDGAKLVVVELLTQKPVVKEKEKKEKKTKEQKEPKVK